VYIKLAQLQKIEVKLKRHKLICNTVQGFENSGVIRWQVGPTVLSAGVEGASIHFAVI